MNAPRVDVAVIVRNADRHLREVLQSFRDQSFSDFRLTVFDNASTDGTAEIVAEYALHDARFHHVRHARDLGPLMNYAIGLERAQAEYFCWAAGDDVREPAFLERLVAALAANPRAGLAACPVVEIDPDGSARNVHPAAALVRNTGSSNAAARLAGFLRSAPTHAFYGLYRTAHVRKQLQLLEHMASNPDRPPLGCDCVFLASFIAAHEWLMLDEPLLQFRLGGRSHQLDAYPGFGAFLRESWRFMRLLSDAAGSSSSSAVERLRLKMLAQGWVAREILRSPLRRMALAHLEMSLPFVARARTVLQSRLQSEFRRLRARARSLTPGSRVLLFGAGKHTRRAGPAIAIALRGRAEIMAVVDDHPPGDLTIMGLPVHSPRHVERKDYDLILISSDTYEDRLFQRARELFGDATPIWRLYHEEPAADMSSRSRVSTSRRNATISSIAS